MPTLQGSWPAWHFVSIYFNLYQGSLLFHINHIHGYKGMATCCCYVDRIATTTAPIMVPGCNYVSTPAINCRA